HGSCLPDLVRRAAIVTAMGLDVYVGSLTRYYAQDWETIVQQWGREQGLPVEVRRSQASPPDRITDPTVIRPDMIKWRSDLNQALSSRLGVELDWEEAPDAPYFTDKPGWDGYGGLVLLAAHEENPQLKPPTRVSLDSWKKDQALRVSSTKVFPRAMSTSLSRSGGYRALSNQSSRV